jgi:hypothetical protein
LFEYNEPYDFHNSFDIVSIGKYELLKTCHACPEQYDVLVDGVAVAYLRLRHGCFRVDVPDCGGETIFVASPYGDGCFAREERHRYLYEAIRRIDGSYSKND